MFSIGSLYRTHIRILLWDDPLIWEDTLAEDFSLEAGNLITLLEMHHHHFVVHTQFGAFRMLCFYDFAKAHSKFEKIA